MIYHIWYMIYHIWLRRDLSDQLLVRRETSTGSRSCVQFAEKALGTIVLVLGAAPPKQYLSWCPCEILTQPWRSCRSARRQGRMRWKHSRPLRRSSKQELWRGRRQSKRIFFISQLFVIDSQKWQQLQFFSGLTSIKRASLFSLADSSVDLSSKD